MWTNIMYDIGEPEKAKRINKWFEDNEDKIKTSNDLGYVLDHINMVEDRLDVIEDKIKKMEETKNG